MMSPARRFSRAFTLAVLMGSGSAYAELLSICDFHRVQDESYVLTNQTNAQRTADGLVMVAPVGQTAAVKIRSTKGAWDASAYTRVVVDVENRSGTAARIRVRVLNPEGTEWSKSATAEGYVPAGKRESFNVYFYRREEDLAAYPQLAVFKGMNGLPGGFQTHWRWVDPADLRAIDLELLSGATDQTVVVHSINATHPVVPPILREKGAAFFPFVDRWGQYRWEEWAGKITSDAELLAACVAEIEDLKRNPPLDDRDAFGGYAIGPKLEPGPFFRVEKVGGKWWLIDPEGNLFWSHGANSVGNESAATRITGREKYFADLPTPFGPLQRAYSRELDGDQRFDHLKANLIRQFGQTFEQVMIGLHNDRMQSWGLNTIGAWSDGNVIAQHRVPYTAMLHPAWPSVKRGVPDVYAPDFDERFRVSVKQSAGTAAGDAWCIGFFIDNELLWQTHPLDFIADLLSSRADAFTKRQFVAQLRAQLGTIDKLNSELGTDFISWQALEINEHALKGEAFEKSDSIRTLALAFYADVCDRYFRSAREAIRAAAPGQMYLGCRMHLQNKLLVEVAAKYCDVLSFNRYENSVADFDAFGADRPVIISEFHFGALDAGMLGTGLRSASNRFDRAMKYGDYVQGALRNPRIVGTHWFAYCPQSITGRYDGENFNTGLFDVCNQPYPEMRDALRTIAKSMYADRINR